MILVNVSLLMTWYCRPPNVLELKRLLELNTLLQLLFELTVRTKFLMAGHEDMLPIITTGENVECVSLCFHTWVPKYHQMDSWIQMWFWLLNQEPLVHCIIKFFMTVFCHSPHALAWISY